MDFFSNGKSQALGLSVYVKAAASLQGADDVHGGRAAVGPAAAQGHSGPLRLLQPSGQCPLEGPARGAAGRCLGARPIGDCGGGLPLQIARR